VGLGVNVGIGVAVEVGVGVNVGVEVGIDVEVGDGGGDVGVEAGRSNKGGRAKLATKVSAARMAATSNKVSRELFLPFIYDSPFVTPIVLL
jgi:hypothetical protein